MTPTSLRALGEVDTNDFAHDLESKLLPGSGDWLLQHPHFRQWIARDEGIFWVQGGPGAGKTMLMSRLTRFLRMSWITHLTERVLCSIFCRYGNAASNTLAGVLKSPIQQLVVQNSDLRFVNMLNPQPLSPDVLKDVEDEPHRCFQASRGFPRWCDACTFGIGRSAAYYSSQTRFLAVYSFLFSLVGDSNVASSIRDRYVFCGGWWASTLPHP